MPVERECMHCGAVEDLVLVDDWNEEYACQDCVDSFYTGCDHCDDLVLINDVHRFNGHDYCESCFEELFADCDRCGDTYYTEDLDYVDGYGYVCSHCRERLAYDSISGYHHSQFHPNETSNFFSLPDESTEQYFGVELEIGGHSSTRYECAKQIRELNTSFFECKSDSSVPADGFEIVSKPATYAFHYNNYWKDVCNISREHGFRSHNVSNCGLHIHVSRKSFENDKTALVKLWSIFHNNEQWLTKFSRRDISDLRSWAKFKTDADVAYLKKNGWEDDSSRYQAINNNPSYTIEFRLYRGTLKYNTFIATLQFTKWLCDYVNAHNEEECEKLNLSRTEFTEYSELMEYLSERDIPEYDLPTPSIN